MDRGSDRETQMNFSRIADKCPNCGKDQTPTSNRCPNCGHKVGLVEGLRADWKRPLTRFEAILFFIVLGLPIAFMGACSLNTALGPETRGGIDFRPIAWGLAAVFIPLFVLIVFSVVKAIRRNP
jgi:DNA-directed RNA polymerase subunit RPC12/RpoP